MKLKNWLLGAGIGLSSLSAQAEKQEHTTEEKTLPKTVLSTDSIAEKKSDKTKKSLLLLPKEEIDSLTNNEVVDTLSADSAALKWGNLTVREKINSCTDMLLIYLTSFEDIRAKAYWERAGGVPTVGPGFVYIGGKKISRNYRFKNMDALINTWNKDLQAKGSWLDNYEAYMYEIIENMHPTSAKELYACQSEICAPFSLVWQNHTKSLGTPSGAMKLLEARRQYSQTGNPIYKNKADSLFEKNATQTMKAYIQYKRTASDEDKETFTKEYMSWCKISLKNKKGQLLRDKNGNVIKRTVPSFVARREAELSYILNKNIMMMGQCPEELKNDTTVEFVDILELAVGATATLKNPKTGRLPENWAEKATKLKADTVTTRYLKEFAELRPSNSSKKPEDKKDSVNLNPLLRYFNSHKKNH